MGDRQPMKADSQAVQLISASLRWLGFSESVLLVYLAMGGLVHLVSFWNSLKPLSSLFPQLLFFLRFIFILKSCVLGEYVHMGVLETRTIGSCEAKVTAD